MKKGFMSIDGKFFTSEAECKEHEKSIGFLMYNENGTTLNPNLALAVSVLSEAGYEEFCCLCRQYNSIYKGVTGVGDWVWGEDDGRYKRIEIDVFESLIRMYNDKYGDIK